MLYIRSLPPVASFNVKVKPLKAGSGVVGATVNYKEAGVDKSITTSVGGEAVITATGTVSNISVVYNDGEQNYSGSDNGTYTSDSDVSVTLNSVPFDVKLTLDASFVGENPVVKFNGEVLTHTEESIHDFVKSGVVTGDYSVSVTGLSGYNDYSGSVHCNSFNHDFTITLVPKTTFTVAADTYINTQKTPGVTVRNEDVEVISNSEGRAFINSNHSFGWIEAEKTIDGIRYYKKLEKLFDKEDTLGIDLEEVTPSVQVNVHVHKGSTIVTGEYTGISYDHDGTTTEEMLDDNGDATLLSYDTISNIKVFYEDKTYNIEGTYSESTNVDIDLDDYDKFSITYNVNGTWEYESPTFKFDDVTISPVAGDSHKFIVNNVLAGSHNVKITGLSGYEPFEETYNCSPTITTYNIYLEPVNGEIITKDFNNISFENDKGMISTLQYGNYKIATTFESAGGAISKIKHNNEPYFIDSTKENYDIILKFGANNEPSTVAGNVFKLTVEDESLSGVRNINLKGYANTTLKFMKRGDYVTVYKDNSPVDAYTNPFIDDLVVYFTLNNPEYYIVLENFVVIYYDDTEKGVFAVDLDLVDFDVPCENAKVTYNGDGESKTVTADSQGHVRLEAEEVIKNITISDWLDYPPTLIGNEYIENASINLDLSKNVLDEDGVILHAVPPEETIVTGAISYKKGSKSFTVGGNEIVKLPTEISDLKLTYSNVDSTYTATVKGSFNETCNLYAYLTKKEED